MRTPRITGASARTIERARAKLGVESRKFGSIWMLRLKSATAPLTLGGDGGVDLSPQATARTHSENTPNSTPPLQLRHTPNGDDLAELKPSGDWLADAIAEDMARGEDGDL